MPYNSSAATRQELSVMFNMPLNIVTGFTRKLVPVEQTGNSYRATFNIRAFAELAIVPQMEDGLIAHIMRMKPDDLPPKLQAAFWNAQLRQQEFETRSKDLWPTLDIVEYVGDAFKTIRLSLQLLPDSIDRVAKLTEPQRAAIQNVVDTLLNDTREKMIDAFENRRESTERGPPPRQEDDSDPDL